MSEFDRAMDSFLRSMVIVLVSVAVGHGFLAMARSFTDNNLILVPIFLLGLWNGYSMIMGVLKKERERA